MLAIVDLRASSTPARPAGATSSSSRSGRSARCSSPPTTSTGLSSADEAGGSGGRLRPCCVSWRRSWLLRQAASRPCAIPTRRSPSASSIVPGLGQLYNRQPRKALFFFLWTVFTIGPADPADHRRAVGRPCAAHPASRRAVPAGRARLGVRVPQPVPCRALRLGELGDRRVAECGRDRGRATTNGPPGDGCSGCEPVQPDRACSRGCGGGSDRPRPARSCPTRRSRPGTVDPGTGRR